MGPSIFILDFDGTCVVHKYPHVGESIGAERVLKRLVDKNHQIVLNTMRWYETSHGDTLSPATAWFKDRSIPLEGIMSHPTQSRWTKSPKAYGHVIIDDTALGCPLKLIGEHAVVDWDEVEKMLEKEGYL